MECLVVTMDTCVGSLTVPPVTIETAMLVIAELVAPFMLIVVFNKARVNSRVSGH